jgi:hypothetical protein
LWLNPLKPETPLLHTINEAFGAQKRKDVWLGGGLFLAQDCSFSGAKEEIPSVGGHIAEHHGWNLPEGLPTSVNNNVILIKEIWIEALDRNLDRIAIDSVVIEESHLRRKPKAKPNDDAVHRCNSRTFVVPLKSAMGKVNGETVL